MTPEEGMGFSSRGGFGVLGFWGFGVAADDPLFR